MASKTRSDGEGSVYYDKSRDRWVGVLVVGWRGDTPETLRPLRKKVSATSRAGAAAKLRKVREDIEGGSLSSGRPLTVEKWLTYWLDEIVAHRNTPNTQRTYRTYVTRYLIPLLGHHRIDRLTPEHLEKAWRTLMTEGCPNKDDAKPLSSTSAHQAHTIMSRALKVAMARGYAKQNVATLVEAPAVRNQAIEILDKDQAGRVIAAARGKRNAARYTVAFSLGLRQGEALGLRWEDVDLERGVLTVRHSLSRVTGDGLRLGPTKSKRERTIVLPKPLLAELKAHRTAQNEERLLAGSMWVDNDHVFATATGLPIDPKDDWRYWTALLKEAEVSHVRLHAARHTAATMLLALGVPVKVAMEILGHTKSSITEGYQHRVDELHIAAADQIAAAWWD